MTNEQRQAVIDTANTLREIVQEIESRPETTQNRYGDYLSLLSQLNERKPLPTFWALCLVIAGGNKQGIESALKIIKP
jgi:hypothetical protein